MTNDEIKSIIKNNSNEKSTFYLNIILEKSKDLSKESNYVSLIMILLILLYYIADYTKLGNLEIGPLSFSNLDTIKVFIPLVFAFLIFRFVVLSAHKAELQKIIKEFTIEYFNFKNSSNKEDLYMDDFTRSLLSFSLFNELGKLNNKKKSFLGCLGSLLIFPVLAFAILPFIFEFFWIKEFLNKYDNLNSIEKWSIILTIWILILSLYYFVQNIINSVNENK